MGYIKDIIASIIGNIIAAVFRIIYKQIKEKRQKKKCERENVIKYINVIRNKIGSKKIDYLMRTVKYKTESEVQSKVLELMEYRLKEIKKALNEEKHSSLYILRELGFLMALLETKTLD